MEERKYVVFFNDNTKYTVNAFRMVNAVIMAQCEQIKLARSVVPDKVYEYASKTSNYKKVYKPNWGFSAREIVENKHPQLIKEGV